MTPDPRHCVVCQVALPPIPRATAIQSTATTLKRILESRKSRGLRELTVTEQSEILTTGFYDEEKYQEPPK